jgi:hypothetical protein
VNGQEVQDGQPVELNLPAQFQEGHTMNISVSHFGREVYNENVDFSDIVENEHNNRHHYTLQTNTSFYPTQFNGVQSARWIGETLAVTWDPPRLADYHEVEVSVAQSESALFQEGETRNLGGRNVTIASNGQGETIAYTFDSDGSSIQIRKRGFMSGPFVLAVRIYEGTRGENFTQEVLGHSSSTLPTGSGVAGLSISPTEATLIPGDSMIVSTEVSGLADANPRVSFSASGGVSVLHSSATKALITADGDGTLTATSEEDVAYSADLNVTTEEFVDQVDRPPAPENLRVAPFGQNGNFLLRWDPPAPDVATRIRINDFVKDTLSNDIRVYGLSEAEIEATLKHLGPDGRASEGSTSISIREALANKSSAKPTTLRLDPLPEIRISPGASQSLDLSQYIKLSGEGAQAARWDNVTAELHHIKTEEGFAATVESSTLTVEADSSSNSASEKRDLLIVRLQNANHDPSFLTIPLARGSSPGFNPTKSIAGFPAEWVGLAEEVDATALVGENPSLYSEGQWEPSLGQVADRLDPTLSEGALDLEFGSDQDGRPAIIVLKGDDGVAAITATDTQEPHYAAPNLPTGSIGAVERNGNWISFAAGLLEVGSQPSGWDRVRQDNKLYNVSLFEPPEEVYYAAPTYFGNIWIDEHKYPDDAEIEFDNGLVRYRNGVTSPQAPEVTPNVDQLTVEPTTGGLDVEWSVSAGGQDLTGVVDVTVTPNGESPFTTQGSGSVSLSGLEQKDYTVEIFSASETAQPLRPQKEVIVKAWRAEDLSYTYRYESDASPDTFTDGFDTEHDSPSFPLEVSAQKAHQTQKVVFEWDDGDVQRVTKGVEWQAPAAPIETTEEVQTAAVLPAGQVPRPEFTRAQHEGSRQASLATNVYGPGHLRMEPEGYLPPGIEGEIEDHVTLTFITPQGEAVGPEINLDTQTELRARAEISAAGGQSPVFYGARVIRTTTS